MPKLFQRLFKMTRPRTPEPDGAPAPGLPPRVGDDLPARRAACRRLRSLAELRAIATTDPDAGIREVAQARYRYLLCREEVPPLSLEERLSELAAADDLRLLEQVATTAQAAELRRAAIDRISDATTLIACALLDPLSSNRCAAVTRLDDKAALEQVAKRIGRKDKGVYRLARQRLKEIAEQEALPQRRRARRGELCERLERLGRFGQWEQDRGILDLIEREWAELAGDADSETEDRYRLGRERFLSGYAAYREQGASQLAAEQARATAIAGRHAILAELAELTRFDDADEVAARQLRAAERWSQDPPLPRGEQAELDRQYRDAIAAVTRHRERLARRRRIAERGQALQAQLDAALAETQPLSLAEVRSLIGEAQTLAADEGLEPPQRDRLGTTAADLEQRLARQRQHAEQRLAQLQPKLAELATSLADGELKRAEPLLQSLQAGVDLAQASGLPRQAYAEIARHIQQAAPRIKTLQGWRRWGADQQREALCQAIDELADGDEPPETLASRLKELQTAWKALDHSGATADRRRWAHFHASAERVYQRCRPFLEQQAAEREANRLAREQVCLELEQFLAQVDWERVDWKKAVKAAHEMRRDWGRIGPTEGRQRRILEQRFHRAIKQLERRLDAERAQNRRLRENLIEEVEALARLSDLERAIEATKACQQRWHTTVAGRKADEQALWERFRAACDAVFGRRRAEIEAREALLQDNLAARSAICAEAEALVARQVPPDELEGTFAALARRWDDTASLPLPRHAASALGQRWRSARQALLQALRQGRDQARRATLELLARQAELCVRLEQAALAGGAATIDLAATRAAWSELPRHRDEALQAAIGARFATALTVLEQGAPQIPAETLAESHREREGLCLQLEILAQIDSPAELAGERLAFQVTRLTERMAAGEKDPLASAAGLLSKWYLCGPAPAAPELEARFARALAALDPGDQRGEALADAFATGESSLPT